MTYWFSGLPMWEPVFGILDYRGGGERDGSVGLTHRHTCPTIVFLVSSDDVNFRCLRP